MTAKVEIINNNGVVEVDIEGQVSENVSISTQTIEVLETNVGGLSTIFGASDTNFSSLADNDFVVWDAATLKFINLSFGSLESAIDHDNILNVGIASHDDIDLHIGDISNPHSVTAAQVAALALDGSGTMTGAVVSSVGTHKSTVIDGAAAVAFDFDTTNLIGNSAATTNAAKLLRLRSGGVEWLSLKNRNSSAPNAALYFADDAATPTNFYSGYHETDFNYAGMFCDFGDFFLGNSSDPTTYCNFYNGSSFIVGSNLNYQTIQNHITAFKFLWSGGQHQLIGNGSDLAWLVGAADRGIMHPDNFPLKFGTEKDSKIYYNGTHLIIDPQAVDSGHLKILGSVDLFAGTAAAGAAPLYFTDGPKLATPENGALEYADGHLLFTSGDRYALVESNGVQVSTNTVVNTVAETVLYSHNMLANSLHSDMRVLFAATGAVSAASGSEVITFRFKVGGVTVHTIIAAPTNGSNIAWRGVHEGTVRTAGVSGQFIDFTEYSESGKAPLMTASAVPVPINTTIANLYEVTAQWGAAKAGNSFSLTQGDLTYKH